MEAEKNVKWVLLVSVIMFFASIFASLLIYVPYYYPPKAPSILDTIVFYINRIDTLLFIATIATTAVHTAGFGRKEITYRLSLVLFMISMALFFVTFMKLVFAYPWVTYD